MKKEVSFLPISWALFSLIILGFVIYSNTFRSSLVCDDPVVITQNPTIRHLNLPILWQAFNTRFVVGVTLAFNYALGKENVVGYHLFNTLVHVLNSFLVYLLVCLTFSAIGGSASGGKTPKVSKSVSVDPRLLGFLTALLFLTHPLQTQAVTYIWQRATSLASFFYLGALVFYIRTRFKFSILSYALCLLFTVLGMFTKEIVFTLPLAMALYELIFLRGIPLKTIQRILLWVPLLLTLLIIPWTMTQTNENTLGLLRPKNTQLRHQENFMKSVLEMTRAVGEDKISRREFVLTQLKVLRTYLRLWILPIQQNVDYDYPRARSLLEPNTLISFLLLFSLVVWGFFLLKNHPLLSFGIFWFFLTVSVESLVAQEEFIFEHRLYLPMVGLSLFLVSAVSYLFKKNPRRLTIILLGIIACYSFLTYQRNFVWKDEFTLWDDTVRKSPYKGRAYYNRGYAYQTKGLLEQALTDYNKAIKLDPDLVDPYIDRASLYEKKGLSDLALTDLNKAIELQTYNFDAHRNRGSLYQKKGLLDLALQDFNKAIELNPTFASVYYNRAVTYQLKGLLDLALTDLNKAIKLKPDYASAYYARGAIYGRKGPVDQALLDFNKAIGLQPNFPEAYNNRAIIYERKGLFDQALANCNKAQSLGFMVDPRFIDRLKKASNRDK